MYNFKANAKIGLGGSPFYIKFTHDVSLRKFGLFNLVEVIRKK